MWVIDKFLENKTIDYIYLGVNSFISDKYYFLKKDYQNFCDFYIEYFKKLQSFNLEIKQKNEKLEETIRNIKFQVRQIDLEIKQDQEKIEVRSIRLDDQKKIEQAIQAILTLEHIEPYKSQMLKFTRDLSQLNDWLTKNSPEKLELRLKENFNKKELLEKEMEEINNEILCIESKIKILDEANSNKEVQFKAIQYIICIVFNKIKIDSVSIKNLIYNQNHLYKKKWINIIKKYFNKPPNFSNIHVIKNNNEGWAYDMFIPENANEFSTTFASIWLSFRNVDFSKQLVTQDKRIFLWITDYIFVEFIFREPIEFKQDIIAIYLNKDNAYNFVNEEIIGGYTSTGFYLPYWIYIVDSEIIFDLYFHQNALLGKNNSNEMLFDNYVKSTLKHEEECRDDD